jgi:hypothetical protein
VEIQIVEAQFPDSGVVAVTSLRSPRDTIRKVFKKKYLKRRLKYDTKSRISSFYSK